MDPLFEVALDWEAIVGRDGFPPESPCLRLDRKTIIAAPTSASSAVWRTSRAPSPCLTNCGSSSSSAMGGPIAMQSESRSARLPVLSIAGTSSSSIAGRTAALKHRGGTRQTEPSLHALQGPGDRGRSTAPIHVKSRLPSLAAGLGPS